MAGLHRMLPDSRGAGTAERRRYHPGTVPVTVPITAFARDIRDPGSGGAPAKAPGFQL